MNNTNNFEKYYINELQYYQLKQVNKSTFKIINNYIMRIYALFKDIERYIQNPYKLLELADKKKFECEYHYQSILYILDKSEKETVANNGNLETIRIFYEDAVETINNIKWDYWYLMFENFRGVSENFDICECLTEEGKKELEKGSKVLEIELEKL